MAYGKAGNWYVNNVEGGGGETWNTVFEGSVTTHDDDGEIFGIIENLTLNGNSIRVTFNGTVYELPKTEHGYGAENESGIDFSTYPLFIATGGGLDSCTLWTLTPGTYSLKIEEPQSGGESDFSTAEVTIPNEGGTTAQYVLPVIRNNVFGVVNVRRGDDEMTFNTVLYKGALVIHTGENIVISGSAEYDDGTELTTITGDCTLKGYVPY